MEARSDWYICSMQAQARKNPVELQTLHLLITIWMIIFAASRLPNSPPPPLLTHAIPVTFYITWWKQELLQDHGKARITLTAELVDYLICLFVLPPPAFSFFFFLRVTLSEEEGGVRWSRSNFGPPFPPPPASPQIKHFYDHPWDQHMYQKNKSKETYAWNI